MYVKIESSGCTERKGLVQIRFAMYLDPGDYGYNVHHVLIPVIPEGGYPGERSPASLEDGEPVDIVDIDAYDAWLDSLPKEWQTNPFHNHFIYVEPDTPNKDIMDIGEAFLHEGYIKWASGEKPDLKNPPLVFPATFDSSALVAKVQSLKTTKLERKV